MDALSVLSQEDVFRILEAVSGVPFPYHLQNLPCILYKVNIPVSGLGLRMLHNTVSGAFPCPVRELPVHLLLHALDVDAADSLFIDVRPFQGDHLPQPGPQLETERNPQAGGIIVFVEVVPCLFFN